MDNVQLDNTSKWMKNRIMENYLFERVIVGISELNEVIKISS